MVRTGDDELGAQPILSQIVSRWMVGADLSRPYSPQPSKSDALEPVAIHPSMGSFRYGTRLYIYMLSIRAIVGIVKPPPMILEDE